MACCCMASVLIFLPLAADGPAGFHPATHSQCRKVGVPFNQSGHRAKAAHGMRIDPPNLSFSAAAAGLTSMASDIKVAALLANMVRRFIWILLGGDKN